MHGTRFAVEVTLPVRSCRRRPFNGPSAIRRACGFTCSSQLTEEGSHDLAAREWSLAADNWTHPPPRIIATTILSIVKGRRRRSGGAMACVVARGETRASKNDARRRAPREVEFQSSQSLLPRLALQFCGRRCVTHGRTQEVGARRVCRAYGRRHRTLLHPAVDRIDQYLGVSCAQGGDQ